MYPRLLIALLPVLILTGQTTPPSAAPAPDTAPAKPASVSGKTVSTSGQPLKKTMLTLRPLGVPGAGQAMPVPYTTSSDAEGKFAFEVVDPGRYMLSADHPGFQRQTYGARRPNSGGTVLTLTSGQTMSKLDLVLSPEIVISGKVLDADGDPAARTQVSAMRYIFTNGKRQLVPAGSATTDDNGEYRVKNLGPGKYYVSAFPVSSQFFGPGTRSAVAPPALGQPVKQEESTITTYYPGVTDATASTIVELTAGHDRPGTDITLRKSPVYHVRGKVSGQIPNDRQQLRVAAMPPSSMFFGFGGGLSSPVGKEGTFDIRVVPPGAYSLVLMNAMGAFKILASAPLDVSTHDVDDLTLAAEAPFDLEGQVKIEKPASPPDAEEKQKSAPAPVRVSLQGIDEPTFNMPFGIAKDDDTFRLTNVSPGHFRVYVSPLPKGAYLKSIRFGDQDALQNGLTVPPGGGSTPLEITLGANAATLTGSVENSEGKPVSSAVITLIPDPPAPDRTYLYHQVNTDQNGRFTIESIAPGKYRAYAWTDLEQGNQYDPDFMSKYSTKGTKLDIAESAAPQITLKPVEQ